MTLPIEKIQDLLLVGNPTDEECRLIRMGWDAAMRAQQIGWVDGGDVSLIEGKTEGAPSVPKCPYPCGWRNLLALAIEDGAYLARSINEDEPVTEHARAATMQMVVRLRDVLIAINKMAQEATA